jgi:predicted transcriptional regulator
LSKPFDISGPAISKHLKVLEKAGLITRGREAQWRPCKIEPQALKGVDEWLERYRKFWEERLDRLDDYLRTLQAEPAETMPKKSRKENKKGKKDGRK